MKFSFLIHAYVYLYGNDVNFNLNPDCKGRIGLFI